MKFGFIFISDHFVFSICHTSPVFFYTFSAILKKNIYLWLCWSSLPWGFSLLEGGRGYSLVVAFRLLIAVTSFFVNINSFILIGGKLLYNIVVVLPYVDMNQPLVYISPNPHPRSYLLPHPIPLGHPSAPAQSTQFYGLNLDWWSVWHMVMYMFQC